MTALIAWMLAIKAAFSVSRKLHGKSRGDFGGIGRDLSVSISAEELRTCSLQDIEKRLLALVISKTTIVVRGILHGPLLAG